MRFDKEVVDSGAIRSVVSTLLGRDPTGDDPDEWIAELGAWVADNSVSVKQTLKRVSQEFDITLDTLEETLSPAFSGDRISDEELVTERVKADAETFITARELLVSEAGETALWDQFTDELAQMETLYGSATITSRMQTTAESGSVPTVQTVSTRLSDATVHRVDVLSEQYRRLTGENTSESEPAEICRALSEWVRTTESEITQLVDDATATFDAVSFDSLRSMFERTWEGEQIDEATLVDSTVQRQAETYATAREILGGDPSPWSQLKATLEPLQAEYPDSPTTESVQAVLTASRPPSLRRVQQLIEEADDPRTGGDVWEDLKSIAGELRQELPNAAVTDEVTQLVDEDDRPPEDQATELLEEAESLLARIREVKEQLDTAEEGSITIIEK